MKGYSEYNEKNVNRLLDKLLELRDAGTIKIQPMIEDLQAKIRVFNNNKPAGVLSVKMYSRSTLYKTFRDRRRVLHAIPKEAYRVTVQYLSERGLLTTIPIHQDLYRATSHFLALAEDSQSEAERLLPGIYLTYRPSLAKPGYAVMALLQIKKRDGGGLVTRERMRYRVNLGEKMRQQKFRGHMWQVGAYYVWLTTDTNTNFLQSSILRCAYKDGHRIWTLEGSYAGFTRRRKGPKQTFILKE